MELNSTAMVHVSGIPSQQPVSGWSVFWALFAIVSNAMLQVSFTGYLFNGNAFESSLWPHRSSPFICLIDMAADIYMVFQGVRNHEPGSEESKSNLARKGAMTRLALFLLGVMPQAIKLFSMQGIPVTQAIAAMFLLSSTISLIASLTLESPEQEIEKLMDSLDDSNRTLQELVKAAVYFLGWCPHLVGIFLLWNGLVEKIGFAAPTNVANGAACVSLILSGLAGVYIIQHLAFMLLIRKPLIPYFPFIMILEFTDSFCVADLLEAPGKRLARGAISRPSLTLRFLTSLGIACYITAIFLNYTVEWAYKRCERCGRIHWRVGARVCTMADSTNSSTATESTTPEVLQTVDIAGVPIQSALDIDQQQIDAEEGTIRTATRATSQAEPQPATMPSQASPYHRSHSTLTGPVPSAPQIPGIILRLILRRILELVLRFTLAVVSIYGPTFYWIEWQVTKRRPPRILMVAFGFVNVVTAAMYYLVFFDADGTVMPGWTNIFG